jgi:hypothetical protein
MLVILVAGVMVFPAAAVWARQRGGLRGLCLLTATVVISVAILALMAASVLGGNRLVESQGYIQTAIPMLLVVGFALILPVVASAAAVWVAGRRLSPVFVYLIAAATALIGCAGGFVLSVYALGGGVWG